MVAPNKSWFHNIYAARPNDTNDRRFNYKSFFHDIDLETDRVFATKFHVRKPHAFQYRARRTLAAMSHPQHPIHPSSVLLVQPTGGGKTLTFVSHTLIVGGFAIIIDPLLALNANQKQKITSYQSTKETGVHNCFNLDEFRSNASQSQLFDDIKKIKKGTKQSFFLFSSPQAIQNSNHFQDLIKHLATNELLTMVVVDELHLFVHFGLSFRAEFKQLKKLLFDVIRIDSYVPSEGKRRKKTTKLYQTKCPVLWMTATASKWIVSELERMTGISITHNRAAIDWPVAKDMFNPKVDCSFVYSNEPIQKFNGEVLPVLKTDRKKKFMWFTNNRYSLENNLKNFLAKIDADPGFKCDVIVLNGDFIKEQNPQVLMLTSSTGNCGIDAKIHGAGRSEPPENIRDAMQEMGWVGRWQYSEKEGVWYFICVSLESFCSLVRRAFRSHNEEGSIMG